MGVSGQRHAPSALCPRGKDSQYPLDRRLGGPQSRSRHRGWRKNYFPLPGIEPRSPSRPVRNQTLYWLSYPGSYRAFINCQIKILIAPYLSSQACIHNTQTLTLRILRWNICQNLRNLTLRYEQEYFFVLKDGCLLGSFAVFSGRKITASLGKVTVRGEKDGKGKGEARWRRLCLSMYSISENIYYSQLSSVAILLQPERNCFISYNTRKGLGSLSLCAIVLRSSPPSHLSTCNGQRSSQLFCVHYSLVDSDRRFRGAYCSMINGTAIFILVNVRI
jgi:hypothetical protein